MISKITAFYSKGTPVQIIVRIAITVILILVALKMIKAGADYVSDLFKDQANEKDVNDVLDTTEPTDGSVPDPNFEPQAVMIAEGQYQAMKDTGTDEQNLFEPLYELNGSELRQVCKAFGSKEGKTLFQWYKDELCGGFPDPCAFFSNVYHHPSVPECDSYLNHCSELGMMKAIWQKSGMPF